MKTKLITYEEDNQFIEEYPLYKQIYNSSEMIISIGAVMHMNDTIKTHYQSNVHISRYLFYRFNLIGLFTAVVIRKRIPSCFPKRLSSCIDTVDVEFEKDHLIITINNISTIFYYWEYPELQLCKMDEETIERNMYQFKEERCYSDNRHQQYQIRQHPTMDNLVNRYKVQ